MDTRTAVKRNVDAELATIRSQMPETYQSIQAKASETGGVFELVRRGLRGEPNCFYAFERGHVVGTPFNDSTIMADVAACMVAFGRAGVCIFAKSVCVKEVADGAH